MVSVPTVSVIVPVYNQGLYLRKAVLSLMEEATPLEIIVVDDGSTDGGLNSISDLSVKQLSTGRRPRGPAVARNVGFKASQGESIVFLDADDVLLPGGIDRRAEFLKNVPECWAVMGRVEEGMGPLGEVVPLPWTFDRKDFPTVINEDYFKGLPFLPCALSVTMFRRIVFDRIGLLNEVLWIGEDQEFIERFLRNSNLYQIPTPVLRYRVHKANLSRGRRARAYVFLSERPR